MRPWRGLRAGSLGSLAGRRGRLGPQRAFSTVPAAKAPPMLLSIGLPRLAFVLSTISLVPCAVHASYARHGSARRADASGRTCSCWMAFVSWSLKSRRFLLLGSSASICASCRAAGGCQQSNCKRHFVAVGGRACSIRSRWAVQDESEASRFLAVASSSTVGGFEAECTSAAPLLRCCLRWPSAPPSVGCPPPGAPAAAFAPASPLTAGAAALTLRSRTRRAENGVRARRPAVSTEPGLWDQRRRLFRLCRGSPRRGTAGRWNSGPGV